MAEKYTVTNVTRRYGEGPGRKLVPIFEVEFTTLAGVVDTLEFRQEEYTPEKVKAALEAAAETHEIIMEL